MSERDEQEKTREYKKMLSGTLLGIGVGKIAQQV